MRLTKAQIDHLHALKTAADAASAAYEAELTKIKKAGAAVYNGTQMALVVEELPRKTVDNKAILAHYNVPERIIAKHTRETTYLRASFKEIN